MRFTLGQVMRALRGRQVWICIGLPVWYAMPLCMKCLWWYNPLACYCWSSSGTALNDTWPCHAGVVAASGSLSRTEDSSLNLTEQHVYVHLYIL